MFPSGIAQPDMDAICTAANASRACLVEIANAADRRPDDMVRRTQSPGSDYRALARFELTTLLHDRGQLLAGLWQLYQTIKSEPR